MEKIRPRERSIKSVQRKKEYAEVFTPEWVVREMCDALGDEAWNDPFKTFLEPACGTGNFLVEILRRKYNVCQSERDGLKALASVVGIDIQADNCQESRERLLEQFKATYPNANADVVLLASQILDNNIICGDTLEIQRQWIEINEGLEHDYNISTKEWHKHINKYRKKKKQGMQLSLFDEPRPPLFAEKWKIYDTKQIDNFFENIGVESNAKTNNK